MCPYQGHMAQLRRPEILDRTASAIFPVREGSSLWEVKESSFPWGRCPQAIDYYSQNFRFSQKASQWALKSP